MGRGRVVAAGVLAGVAALAGAAMPGVVAQTSRQMPVFEVDASWPPALPNNWVLGQVPGIAVDRQDHVWVLHRPRTVPEAQRARAAPAVLEFDERGRFVNAWGGPGTGFDWPDSEHGIFVDHKDNVWVGGSSPTSNSLTKRSDDMLVKFTSRGRFLLQIGGPDKSRGNADTMSVNNPADAVVYPKTNELFVADGYGNRRVIVFDADSGAFKRMWGGFGNVPIDAAAQGRGAAAGGAPPAGTPPSANAALDTAGEGPQQFGGPVHSVKVSNDGLVYVADRANRRIQVFDLAGKYRTQGFINRAGPSTNSVAGLAFSPDPEQRFLYVADYGNSRIAILDRATLDVLYQFGGTSEKPGDFRGPHHLAVDSKGNIFVAEVSPGNRAQRFVFKGLATARPANALP